jgi:hypothetical protein
VSWLSCADTAYEARDLSNDRARTALISALAASRDDGSMPLATPPPNIHELPGLKIRHYSAMGTRSFSARKRSRNMHLFPTAPLSRVTTKASDP